MYKVKENSGLGVETCIPDICDMLFATTQVINNLRQILKTKQKDEGPINDLDVATMRPTTKLETIFAAETKTNKTISIDYL